MVNKKKTDSKKIKINKYLIAGLIITGIVIIIGIISAFATPYSTTEMSAAEKFAAPLHSTSAILSPYTPKRQPASAIQALVVPTPLPNPIHPIVIFL